MKLNRKNKKGFTIVELVIVIAVIGILSAILIPTFANLTTEAQKAAKKQQVSDAYTAYLVEATDNKFDGLFTRTGDSEPYTYEVADIDIAQKSQAEVALLIGTNEWYLYDNQKGWEKSDSYAGSTTLVCNYFKAADEANKTLYAKNGNDYEAKFVLTAAAATATADEAKAVNEKLSTFNNVKVYVR